MNFFTGKHQYRAALAAMVTFMTFNQDVMVGQNDDIHFGFEGGLNNGAVISGAIRVGGMHV
ncbi:MAG: hypothetical protein ACD_34C00646G0001 [uncultured bacterium]|nr:MAG: hypothetical protein ACD_34C00646G0001 [uncultured bacterium]